MTEVETRQEGGFYLCEASGRARSKCLSGPGLQAVVISCAVVAFINNLFVLAKRTQSRSKNEEVFFFLAFLDRLGISLIVLISHFLLSPFLLLSSITLAPASGQPVKVSEWLSALRLRGLIKLWLTPRFLASQATHSVPSHPLWLLLADPEYQEARQ